MTKARKVLCVKWADSSGRGRWVTEKLAREYEPELITSVGLLVHRTRHKIILAISCDKDNDIADTLTRPRGCVKDITELAKIKV